MKHSQLADLQRFVFGGWQKVDWQTNRERVSRQLTVSLIDRRQP